jgi:hypothetical protein
MYGVGHRGSRKRRTTDPRASCFYARRTLELGSGTGSIQHDKSLRLPYPAQSERA